MLSAAPIVLPQAAVDEARTYLRVEGSGEDPLVARLLRSAAELCERFTGQALLARSMSETLPATGAWQRLGATPVTAISAIERLSDGAATALATADYAIDIDANGDGWVRVPGAGSGLIRVSFEAGMAAQWTGVPETLRQGIIRLATHFYMHRDRVEDAPPPAAVTALWRPWRRIQFGPMHVRREEAASCSSGW